MTDDFLYNSNNNDNNNYSILLPETFSSQAQDWRESYVVCCGVSQGSWSPAWWTHLSRGRLTSPSCQSWVDEWELETRTVKHSSHTDFDANRRKRALDPPGPRGQDGGTHNAPGGMVGVLVASGCWQGLPFHPDAVHLFCVRVCVCVSGWVWHQDVNPEAGHPEWFLLKPFALLKNDARTQLHFNPQSNIWIQIYLK